MTISDSIWLMRPQLEELHKRLRSRYKSVGAKSAHELGRFRTDGALIILYKTGTVYSPDGLEEFRDEIVAAIRSKSDHSEYDIVIGQDETGKGELFGPMVTASVALTHDQIVDLQLLGVRDSKKLKDDEIDVLADKVSAVALSTSIVSIGAKKFSTLFEKFKSESKSLNDLLAWAHVKALDETLNKISSKIKGSRKIIVIIDEFGKKSLDHRLGTKNKLNITVVQMHHAEKTSIAVAAASILARHHRNRVMARLVGRLGFDPSSLKLREIEDRPELLDHIKMPYLKTMQKKQRSR